MADTAIGLTDYAKEMARWNTPYVYAPLPQMLYRGVTRAGRVAVEQRVVETEREQTLALEQGWRENPQTATDEETRRQEQVGTAAAERAYADQRLSPRAQAEAAAADQAAGAKHLGEIPERPRRPRPSRAKTKNEAPA
jgi:hypothetical protein